MNIHELRAKGLSYNEIARVMNEHGERTIKGNYYTKDSVKHQLKKPQQEIYTMDVLDTKDPLAVIKEILDLNIDLEDRLHLMNCHIRRHYERENI